MDSPIRKPTLIGLPWHGFYRDGTLTLPNSDTMTVSVSGTGIGQVIRHPAAAGDTRTQAEIDADALLGKEYRDYAIKLGSSVGGAKLPQTSSDSRCWVYIDGNGVPWCMEVRRQFWGGIEETRMTVYCRGRFGLIAPEQPLISTLDKSCGVAVNPYTTTSGISRGSVSQTETGDKAVLVEYVTSVFETHPYVYLAIDGVPEFTLDHPGAMGWWKRALAIYTIEVSGNGASPTDPTGITATCTREDLSVTKTETSGAVPGNTYGSSGSGTWPDIVISFDSSGGPDGGNTTWTTNETVHAYADGTSLYRIESETVINTIGYTESSATGSYDCSTGDDSFGTGSITRHGSHSFTRTYTLYQDGAPIDTVTESMSDSLSSGELWDGTHAWDCIIEGSTGAIGIDLTLSNAYTLDWIGRVGAIRADHPIFQGYGVGAVYHSKRNKQSTLNVYAMTATVDWPDPLPTGYRTDIERKIRAAAEPEQLQIAVALDDVSMAYF